MEEAFTSSLRHLTGLGYSRLMAAIPMMEAVEVEGVSLSTIKLLRLRVSLKLQAGDAMVRAKTGSMELLNYHGPRYRVFYMLNQTEVETMME